MRKLLCVVGIAVAGALALPASGAAAPVTVGHSSWSWGNPVPQGNTLRAIEFTGGRGYAAGAFGTVMRTDDGGLNWTGIATGIVEDLQRVRALGENTVIIGAGCLLRRSDDGGQTFRRLPFVPSEQRCPAGVSSFHFPTADVGYLALSDGTVLRTGNGGSSFARRTAVPGTAATGAGGGTVPTDIFFTGVDQGVAIVNGGEIYRTTDGGGSWTQVSTGDRPLNSVFFVDATNGYAVGDANTVYKTSDGGENWSLRPVTGDVPPSDFSYIRCANANLCLIATKGGERVVRTNDGGTTFTAVTPSTQKIFAVAFQTESNVVGVGEGGATVVSADGGQTYETVGTRLSGTYNRLRATSQQLVYAMGDNGQLARTTDGGETWSTIGVATSEDLLDASFATQDDGYALDVSGNVFKTDDEGANWAPLDPGVTTAARAILALDANTAFLVGPRGMRVTRNGGETPFEPVEGPRALNRASLGDIDRGGSGTTTALFTWGSRALFTSTDDGESWRAVRRPGGRRSRLRDVDFVSSRIGFALTTDGRVWGTRTGGRRWTESRGTGNGSGSAIAFNGANDGFMTVNRFGGGNFGYVLRTSDGGRTWRPQLVDNQPVTGGLVAPATGNAYLLNPPSTFFFTKANGDLGILSDLRVSSRTRTIRRTKSVKVTGRLSPAVAGAQVFVSARQGRSSSWSTQAATVSSSGTFTTSFRISRTTYFVAQWRGDADRNGDGSAVLTIRRR
jgi:photosystem II stability/assembly factor-like uncharacterized protein